MKTLIMIGLLTVPLISAPQNLGSQSRPPEIPTCLTATLDDQLPSDPALRLKRIQRNKAHNLTDGKMSPEERRQFAFNEKSAAVVFELPLTHSRPLPPLPVKDSSVIVKGTVMSAAAYVSQDNSSVYSEFNVRVAEVLKPCLVCSIVQVGTTIQVTRYGGRVRLPSGRTLIRGQLGKAMPEVGRDYFFFLKWDPDVDEFPIVTAYSIEEKTVSAMDSLDPSSNQLVPPELTPQGFEQLLKEQLANFNDRSN